MYKTRTYTMSTFEERFPLIQGYATGYDRYYQLRRLNCMYNKAVRLASTTQPLDEAEAIILCELILAERRSHMEARALLSYLCS